MTRRRNKRGAIALYIALLPLPAVHLFWWNQWQFTRPVFTNLRKSDDFVKWFNSQDKGLRKYIEDNAP